MKREALLQELRERTPNSGAYWEKAKNMVPGGLMSGARKMEPYPVYIDRVKGAYAWDIDGNRYIDCVCSFGIHLLGHGPEPVLEAIRKQIEIGMVLGIPHPHELEFTERFIDCVPCAEMGMVCNTGTESTMLAFRLMRAATGKPRIAKFEGGFHGWHDYGQLSVLPNPQKWGPVERPNMIAQTAGIPDAVKGTMLILPFHEAAFGLIEEHADELAGVAIEPITGGQNLRVPTEFLEKLRDVCHRNGVLLMFDEVITGFRVALGGCQELTGVLPDVATYGKIIGGGIPIGAVACSKSIVEAAQKSDDGLSLAGTFSGNPLTLAAGVATLKYLQENRHLYDDLEAKGNFLRSGFNEWTEAEGHPFRMTNNGSMFQIYNLDTIPRVPRDLGPQNLEMLTDLQLHMRLNGLLHPWLHLAFFGTAHTQQDIEEMLRIYKASVTSVMGMESGSYEAVGVA